jgi:hypothetical protein
MAIDETVVVTEVVNDILVSTPGPQGPRGKTILNGSGVPASNLGLEGDFYYDRVTTNFYGPKLSDITWDGVVSYKLQQVPADFSREVSWELNQVTGPVAGVYSVSITHNLDFKPNVTIKNSAGDLVETGIDYVNNNQLILTMAQPFSGTAYLS